MTAITPETAANVLYFFRQGGTQGNYPRGAK